MKKIILYISIFLLVVSSISYLFINNVFNQNKLDVSIDKKQEIIYLEGIKEEITTMKYISSLGYHLRYDIDNFSILKDENKDIYKTINPEVYVVVEISTISYEKLLKNNYEKDILNGIDTLYYIENNKEYIYLKGNDKTFLITINCPNTPEYKEGFYSRIIQMLDNGFEIND